MTLSIRVVLADDHPVVRLAVRQALANPAIEVVGEAQDVSSLLGLLQSQPCDVAVIDLMMPGSDDQGDALQLVSTLRERFPDLRLVVLTSLDASPITQRLESLGATRVISKRDDLTGLIAAVFAAHAGRNYLSASVGQKAGIPETRATQLSPRERAILRMFAEGMKVNDIASELGRSKQAVSTHKKNGMRKLGLATDADIFLYARDIGLLS